jgi:hypothetical protein
MNHGFACLALLTQVLISCGSSSPESCAITASLSMRVQSNLSEERTFEAGLARCARLLTVNTGDAEVEVTTVWNRSRLPVTLLVVSGSPILENQFAEGRYHIRLPLEETRRGARLRVSGPPSTSGEAWPSDIHIVVRVP